MGVFSVCLVGFFLLFWGDFYGAEVAADGLSFYL
jgi:hypothetical protein